MAEERNIRDVDQQSLYGQPMVKFRKNDFDAVIWAHGYDVICETAIRCPCCGDSGAPKPDCQNCHGFGYFFVNPRRTKALITGLNRSTNYVQWSPELMGTAAITVRDEDKGLITFFNRVKVENEYATFTEMQVARSFVGNGDFSNDFNNDFFRGTHFLFLSYAPIEVLGVWVYDAYNHPLKKLDEGAYEISNKNEYCLLLKAGSIHPETGVSVLYRHRVEYHIIDLPHEIRASIGRNKLNGNFEIIKLPIQGIGRRTHLINMQKPNFDGTGIIYNDDDSLTY